jgi:hypothetical protein
MNESPNTLKLGEESFDVARCRIWGYLGKRADQWYCRWCIAVDCKERTYTWSDDDGDEYSDTLCPEMEGNTLPISVDHWRHLDGVVVESGPDVDFEYLDPNDQRAIYSVYVYSHNPCSNNVIRISHTNGAEFRVSWKGTAHLFGANDDPFELDADANFTDISLSGEVEKKEDVSDQDFARIFAKVFSPEDFTQHPATVRRIEEDGEVYIDFNAKFTPRTTAEP